MRYYNNEFEDYDHYEVGQSMPLLEWMLANLKGSRSKLKATLQGRGVRVNDKYVTQFDYQLKPGMRVSISKSKRNDRFKSRYVKMVYEDQYLVVVEKNVGILSMAAGHSSLNVKSVLDDYFQRTRQQCRAHVVHRLDRDTSGLMVVSKSKEVSQRFEEDWKGMVFDRRYVAVAWGHIEPPKGEIRSWLTDGEYCVLSSPTDNGGKLAVTHYEVRQTSRRYSLVDLKLDTGRRNQIRVHLRELKHPVVHDPMYGYKDDISPVARLCLHAYRLCFTHPVTGKRMKYETPVPSAFMKLMEL